MAASNTVWRIEWGNYRFALDRKTLTYDLTETQTGTVWASSLPVGWIELANRSTDALEHYDFSGAKIVSIVEKSGAQGKRLLIGLDILGVPIDLYFICSEREIQLVVEASRDTSTHFVTEIGLLPKIGSVTNDGASHLVLPWDTGRIAFAREMSWGLEAWAGVSMPFAGAVHCSGNARNPQSAICLMIDSAYGQFDVDGDAGQASVSTRFHRDPERRRMEVRIRLIPRGDYIAITKAYRDRLIAERGHIPLRRKMRERPQLSDLIGSAAVDRLSDPTKRAFSRLELSDLRDRLHIERIQVPLNAVGDEEAITEDWLNRNRNSIDDIRATDFRSMIALNLIDEAGVERNMEQCASIVSDVLFWDFAVGLDQRTYSDAGPTATRNRWEEMEWRLDRIKSASNIFQHVGVRCPWNEWAIPYVDFVHWGRASTLEGACPIQIPLWSVCHHDTVINLVDMLDIRSFLLALTTLSLPIYTIYDGMRQTKTEFIKQTFAILSPLHALTFWTFLTEHRFHSDDLTVTEAVYSDGTRIVVNSDELAPFDGSDLHLPPLGFYVRHPQMEAHDALRVGDQTFPTRAWRIRRSLDGKPLEESEDVLVQEFPV